MIEEKDKGLIVQNYKLAKDKENQVAIEAELHGVDTATIRGLLWDAGAYPIGPAEIEKAATKVLNGVTFGEIRNHMKAFQNIDAKTAKKIFKDYAYKPWGEGFPPTKDSRYRELAQKALDARKEKHYGNGHPKQDLVPAPAVAAKPFTDAQAGLMVAALISLVTEKEFLRDQMQKDVNDLHANAKELLDLAESKMADINKIEEDIAEGRGLLEQLEEQVNA